MIITLADVTQSLAYESGLEWHPTQVSRLVLDNSYYVPRLVDVRTEVATYIDRMQDKHLTYRWGEYDCNAYAMIWYAWVKFQAWQDDELRPPWPFGYFFSGGRKNSSVVEGHAMNMCLVRGLDDGLFWVWIEPQTGAIGVARRCEWGKVWLAMI